MTVFGANHAGKILFADSLNRARKANKGKWVFNQGSIGGVPYAYKAYNTYIQRLTVGAIHFDSPCECSVREFLETLGRAFDHGVSLQAK